MPTDTTPSPAPLSPEEEAITAALLEVYGPIAGISGMTLGLFIEALADPRHAMRLRWFHGLSLDAARTPRETPDPKYPLPLPPTDFLPGGDGWPPDLDPLTGKDVSK